MVIIVVSLLVDDGALSGARPRSPRGGDVETGVEPLRLRHEGVSRCLVLGVGLELNGLLDPDEPETAVGAAADDAFRTDGEVVERQLLVLGEGDDGDCEDQPAAATNASSGLQRAGSVPLNSGGVAIASGSLPAALAVVRRPPSQPISTGKRNSRRVMPSLRRGSASTVSTCSSRNSADPGAG